MVTKRKRPAEKKAHNGAAEESTDAASTSDSGIAKILLPPKKIRLRVSGDGTTSSNGLGKERGGSSSQPQFAVDPQVQLAGQKIVAIMKTVDGSKRLLSGGTVFDRLSKEERQQRSQTELDRLARHHYIDFVLESSSASFDDLAAGFERWFKERKAGFERIPPRDLDVKRKGSLLRHYARLQKVCTALVEKAVAEDGHASKPLDGIGQGSRGPRLEPTKYGLYQSTADGFIFSNLAKGLDDGELNSLDLAKSNLIAIEAMPTLVSGVGAEPTRPLTFRETSRRVKDKLAVDPARLKSRSEKPIPEARFPTHAAFQSFAPGFDSSFGYLTPDDMSMVWEYRVQAKYLRHLRSGAVRALRSRVRGWQGKMKPFAPQTEPSPRDGAKASPLEPMGLESALDKGLFEQEGLDIDAILSSVSTTGSRIDPVLHDSVYDPARSLQSTAEALLCLQQLQRERLLTESTSQVRQDSEEWRLAQRLQTMFLDLLNASPASEKSPGDRTSMGLANHHALAKGNLGHLLLDQGYSGALAPPPPAVSAPQAAESGRFGGQQRQINPRPAGPHANSPGGTYRGPGRPRIYPPGSTPSSRAAAQRAASQSGSPTPLPLPPIPKYSQQPSSVPGIGAQSSTHLPPSSHFSVPMIPRAFAQSVGRR